MNTGTKVLLALLGLAVGLWLYQLGKADFYAHRTAGLWGQDQEEGDEWPLVSTQLFEGEL